MEHAVFERSFMFIGLALMYMMLSCMVIEARSRESDKLFSFFQKRINDPRFSHIWKIFFICLKYVQNIVLLLLFFNGMEELNNLRNLGFMIFFCFYTAYEELYRKTSVLLIVFIGFFIIT